MRPITCILYFILVAFAGQCQYDVQNARNEVLEMFGERKVGVWIKHYRGQADELQPVHMILGHNTADYKGIVYDGDIKRFIEGEMNGDTFRLIVFNSNEEVSGLVDGNIKDSIIQASYSDVHRNNMQQWYLVRTRNKSEKSDCSKNKWIKLIEGELLNDQACIYLQKEEDHSVNGLVYFSNQRFSYDISGDCLDVECNKSRIFINNDQGQVLGSILLSKKNGLFEAVHQTSDDEIIRSQLVERNNYKLSCNVKLIHNNRISFVIPQLKNNKFNDWVSFKIGDWVKSLIGQPELSDPNRWGDYRAWVDVDYINDQLISGTLTMHNVDFSAKRESFIFPADSKQPKLISHWAKDPVQFGQFLDDIIKAQRKKLSSDAVSSEEEWYGNQSFQHRSIRQEGLCLKTDFSSFYGERRITIPWDVVLPYLKRSNPVKKYITNP